VSDKSLANSKVSRAVCSWDFVKNCSILWRLRLLLVALLRQNKIRNWSLGTAKWIFRRVWQGSFGAEFLCRRPRRIRHLSLDLNPIYLRYIWDVGFRLTDECNADAARSVRPFSEMPGDMWGVLGLRRESLGVNCP
jgi:hypothetical protein